MRRTRLMTLGAVVCLVVASGSLWAGEPRPNLLPNPGFENLEESFVEEGVVLEKGEVTWDAIPGWRARCEAGKLRISGDKRERTEGETSLKIEFVSADADNNGYVGCNVAGVKPDAIYELSGMIKAQNVNWVTSFALIRQHDKDGKYVEGAGSRLLNYPSSKEFLRRKNWHVTGPRTRSLDVRLGWKGRPQKVGIVQQPSIVWLDDLKLVEVGPAYPASGRFLREDFEGKELQGWILTGIGAHWNPTGPGFGDARNPRISDEKAHSGKQSLKLFPTWGAITRPFAENITDCVVTAWFYEEPGDKCRMVMLIDEKRKEVGLGTIRESISNYACYLGSKSEVTDVKKSAEWHEFKFAVTKGQGITFCIDGTEVGQTDQMDSFRSLQLGAGWWRGSTCYIDDISIQLKD